MRRSTSDVPFRAVDFISTPIGVRRGTQGVRSLGISPASLGGESRFRLRVSCWRPRDGLSVTNNHAPFHNFPCSKSHPRAGFAAAPTWSIPGHLPAAVRRHHLFCQSTRHRETLSSARPDSTTVLQPLELLSATTEPSRLEIALALCTPPPPPATTPPTTSTTPTTRPRHDMAVVSQHDFSDYAQVRISISRPAQPTITHPQRPTKWLILRWLSGLAAGGPGALIPLLPH